MKPATELIRSEGVSHDAEPLTTPVYETTTFVFENAAEVRAYNEGKSAKFLYSRYANPTVLAWLKEHATPVFTSEGPTNGDTTLWFVREADLDVAASANIGFPSKDHGTER